MSSRFNRVIDPEFKKLWVEALRSGKYKQGEGVLRDGGNRFCCLGVACDLIDPDGWKEEMKDTSYHNWYHSGLKGAPSHKIMMKLFGTVEIPQVTIKGRTLSLAQHNDFGHTFEEIAKAIEEQL